jgi:hypothetical protein
MFVWLILSSVLFSNLVLSLLSASAARDPGNGLAVAMGVVAVWLVLLSAWVIIHLALALAFGWSAVQRDPTALTPLRVISVYLLASAVLLGFGLTAAELHRWAVTGISSRGGGLINGLRYLMPVLVAVNAAACVYLFHSVEVHRAFGRVAPDRELELGPHLRFSLIAALLIMVLYKEAHGLSFWLFSRHFTLSISMLGLKYLVLMAASGGVLAAAVIGLRALKSEVGGFGPLPACLGLILFSRLLFLSFNLYDILTRLLQSRRIDSWAFSGLVNLLEATVFAFLLYHVLSRRQKITQTHDFTPH